MTTVYPQKIPPVPPSVKLKSIFLGGTINEALSKASTSTYTNNSSHVAISTDAKPNMERNWKFRCARDGQNFHGTISHKSYPQDLLSPKHCHIVLILLGANVLDPDNHPAPSLWCFNAIRTLLVLNVCIVTHVRSRLKIIPGNATE